MTKQDQNKTTDTSEVAGLGTVRVDGEVNEVIGSSTFKSSTAQQADDNPKKNPPVSADSSCREKSSGGASAAAEEEQSAAPHAAPTQKHFPEAPLWQKQAKSGAIWTGAVLISLGVLILLDMLSGVIPELSNIFGGHSVWRFWPILIIFGGLAIAFSPATSSPNPRQNGKVSPSRFSEGLFVITIGLVLLGNSLGFVAWSSWFAMLSYWPLLLVIAGLAILSHGLKSEWFSVIAYVLSIIALIAVAASMWIGPLPLAEPFASLAELGSYRGIDLFGIGSRIGDGVGSPR